MSIGTWSLAPVGADDTGRPGDSSVDGESSGATPDLLLAWGEAEEALEDYLEAEAYACGEVDEVFTSTGSIARKLAMASRHYAMPFISVPISARVSRCKILSVKIAKESTPTKPKPVHKPKPGESFQPAEVEPPEIPEQDKWITAIWDANDLDVWYPELFEKTFMFGDAYVQVHPVEGELEDDKEAAGADEYADSETIGSPADEELIAAGVEFTVHDPKHVRMIYEKQHTRRKRMLINRWPVPDPTPGSTLTLWRADLWYSDRVEHWITIPNGNPSVAEGWMPYADDVDAPTPVEFHDFGEIPFFHHRTKMPYGVPVHKRGYGAQNAASKMFYTQIDTSEEQGFPQRYRLLDPDAELDQNNDNPEFLDDDDAAIFNGSGGLANNGGVSSAVRGGPGTMQTYPGTKEVGQFESADGTAFTEPGIIYLKALAILTETPVHLFWPEETSIGAAPSGAAYAKAEGPLLASVQRLQTLQRGAIREEWTFAARQVGVTVKPSSLDVQWEPVERATSMEDWTTVLTKQEAGVPVDTTLQEAGYTPEQAAQWQADKQAADQQAKDEMLAAIGEGAVKGKDPRAPGAQK